MPLPDEDEDLAALYPWPAEPFVRANFTSSVDGSATRDGRSGGLSGPADRRVFTHLRTTCDAVLVGAGTARVERYRPAPVPVVVVSGRLDLDPAERLFTPGEGTARPVIVTHAGGPADRRARLAEVADVVDAGTDHLEPDRLLAVLADRGLRRVLCEGGPRLFATLAVAGVVDELCITFHPLLIGPAHRGVVGGDAWERVVELELRHAIEDGGELLCRYALTAGAR